MQPRQKACRGRRLSASNHPALSDGLSRVLRSAIRDALSQREARVGVRVSLCCAETASSVGLMDATVDAVPCPAYDARPPCWRRSTIRLDEAGPRVRLGERRAGSNP